MSNKRRCGFGVDESNLSEHDRAKLSKFKKWFGLEASRRSGGDPAMLNMLEAVIYPEGIGRPPIDEIPES